MTFFDRHPWLPYVGPFALFMVLLAAAPYVTLPDRVEFPLRIALLGAAIWFFSRGVLSLRPSHTVASVLVGIAVFAIWVAPDLLFAGYRTHWLFQNSITGTLKTSLSESARDDLFVLSLRSFRAIALVPIIEELFWRAFLMRWLIESDFRKVALGAFTPYAFTVTALLFASEHGPYWDVGLLAGFAYNWWLVRTKSLGDCILAHAVTNACLCAFVLLTGRWEYWL